MRSSYLRSKAARWGTEARDIGEIVSVQRLFKKYQEQGLVALITTERADRGQYRISEFWQNFILNTYKTGNKGSRRLTPKQAINMGSLLVVRG